MKISANSKFKPGDKVFVIWYNDESGFIREICPVCNNKWRIRKKCECCCSQGTKMRLNNPYQVWSYNAYKIIAVNVRITKDSKDINYDTDANDLGQNYFTDDHLFTSVQAAEIACIKLNKKQAKDWPSYIRKRYTKDGKCKNR